MKIIYIVGLEHSGTTLIDHLLSGQANILGLGEVSAFFSPTHMQHYMQNWGNAPDVSLCSCGQHWETCEFWKNFIHLCGLHSEQPTLSKYQYLLTQIRQNHGDNAIIVDSSKSIETLNMLLNAHHKLGLSLTDIIVIFAIKDVRSFSASIIHKQENNPSLLKIWQSFNYWLGGNKRILHYLHTHKINFSISLYETLCADPEQFLKTQLSILGHLAKPEIVNIKKNTSHIAMGNKSFTVRNRNRISYDNRWYHNNAINFIYLAHRKARAFNHHISRLENPD